MAEEIESIYTLDVSKVLANLELVDSKFAIHEERMSKLGKTDPFKDAAKGAGDLDKELSAGAKTMANMEATTAALKEEIKKLTAEQERLIKKQKELEAAFQSDNIKKEIQVVQDEQKKLGNEIDNTTKKAGGLKGAFSTITGKVKEIGSGLLGTGGIMGRFATIAAGTFALVATAAVAVGMAVYKARERYMEMNDAMLAITGNQKDVTNNMEVLDTIADKLGYTLATVTSAYAALANEGLKPTKGQLKDLGVLAQELKTDFTQLSLAIVAADKGQLESLRKLGVQAQAHGNTIDLSFRGITTSFKKGSGDSVKALAQISSQMEKTENSAEKLGRLDFMDRLAKGFVDAETSIAAAGESSDTKAYPAFDRLFKLLGRGKVYVMDLAESFGIWLSTGWAHIVNDASLLVSVLGYQVDVLTNGFTKANANLKTAKDAFLKNRKEIFATEERLQANVGKDQGGELVNNGTKLVPEDLEAKRAREKAAREAKKRADERLKELLKAEKDLQDALMKLQTEYGKDKLEALKGDTLKYLEEKKKLNLQEIDIEEKALLKLKQLAVGARKGKFDANNKPIADLGTTLSESEKEPLNFRRQLVTDQSEMEKAKFINDNEKAITKLLSNEYQQQLQDIEHKYEEIFNLAKQSGIDIVKIEKQKQKDIDKATLENNLSKLDGESSSNLMATEIDVIQAQIDQRIDAEMEARKRLLEIEKSYNEAKIKIIEASGVEDAKARILPLIKANKQIEKELNDLDKTAKANKFNADYWITKIFGEDGAKAFGEAASSIGASVSELYDNMVKMSENRVNRIEDEIKAKQDQVDSEKELNQKGIANNLDLRLKELEALKAARERALKDQQRIQKAQMIMDTISQASSMISAAAKVYAGFAGIPIVGVGLGIAAVALMLGAFAAAKVKSFQLAKQASAEKFEKGGRHGGRLHSEGGNLVEVERDEWTINRKSSLKYDGLLEAINNNNQGEIMDYLIKDLLSGTGVGISDPERKEAMKFMREHASEMSDHEGDLIKEVRNLRTELQDIKKGTNKIPNTQLVNVGDGKYAEISPSATIVREIAS